MEEKNDIDKLDDVVMPGFRFHPTDEELVGFYLKRKIQQRPLPIELIKQVDIYKYDPWDLPKELSTTGEKEWYFYCPRDRKYKNSERPNRVTGAGFWKATGTDRPIYFSHGTKCIGLKKSLVFYRGRAAKGIKTDWMMHEFRLPSLTDSSPQKKLLDKTIPPNDAWAICRIFKKTNSMSQRALSHSWVSPLPQTAASDILSQGEHSTQFSSENVSSTTEIASVIQSCGNTDLQQASTTSFSAFHIPSYKPLNPTFYKPPLLPISTGDLPNNNMFSSPEISGPNKCTNDVPSMFLNTSLFGDIIKGSENNIGYDGPQQQLRGFSISMHQDTQGNITMQEDETAGSKKNPNATHDNNWGTIQSIGFPLSLPLSMPDAWKLNVPWDSPPCPSEMSTTYSPNNCYT